MEKRKAVYQDGNYQLLKPKNDGNNESWHGYGKIKTLKAINDISNKKRFEFIIDPDVEIDLERYRKNKCKRFERYLSKGKNLESKTI